MTDSSIVYWSGKAADDTTAREAAMDYAVKEGKEVFYDATGLAAICPRPLPAPRGRKAKTQETTTPASDDTSAKEG
jgi:hypothetical protein